MRLEVVDSFAGLYRGKGGFWEDRGYEMVRRHLMAPAARKSPLINDREQGGPT